LTNSCEVLLRGKQWLIVGDGKQVSPSENFVSESQIESLTAALPTSPFQASFLPGNSFFDLATQAFPMSRVVLTEHYRCAPELIEFCNHQFYHSKLIPLRLPTRSERMTPSLIDVRVSNGIKNGKINKRECDTIVSMVKDMVSDGEKSQQPRSIGIISFIGNEQSRLLRGLLLDAVGPKAYKDHDVLIGEPPSFQGAERDVIFLSLVGSPGSVPTQNQLMHVQRANVALSRARDRMVLVRSIDCGHVPNAEDIKVPIIEFFAAAAPTAAPGPVPAVGEADARPLFSCRHAAERVLECALRERGYSTRSMGVVWKDALCVEDETTGSRAAICIECIGESESEWNGLVAQQKLIERVGWKCLRCDAFDLVADFFGTLQAIQEFLAAAGLTKKEPPREIVADSSSSVVGTTSSEGKDLAENTIDGHECADSSHTDDDLEEEVPPPVVARDEDAVVISSDDDTEMNPVLEGCLPLPMDCLSSADGTWNDDTLDPEKYGNVVGLTFLQGHECGDGNDFYDQEHRRSRTDSCLGDARGDPYAGDDRAFPHVREDRTAADPHRVGAASAVRAGDSSRGARPSWHGPVRGDHGAGPPDARARRRSGRAAAATEGPPFPSIAAGDAPGKRRRSEWNGEFPRGEGPSRPAAGGGGAGGRRRPDPDGDEGSSRDADPRGSDDDDDGGGEGSLKRPRTRRSNRLSKYARDGRYFPGRKDGGPEDAELRDYDTDSDLYKQSSSGGGSPDTQAFDNDH